MLKSYHKSKKKLTKPKKIFVTTGVGDCLDSSTCSNWNLEGSRYPEIFSFDHDYGLQKCVTDEIQEFPQGLVGATGALINHKYPLVCGGEASPRAQWDFADFANFKQKVSGQEPWKVLETLFNPDRALRTCRMLRNGKWLPVKDTLLQEGQIGANSVLLQEGRIGATSVLLDQGLTLFVTGGDNGVSYVNSTEFLIFDDNGTLIEQRQGPEMPSKSIGHCILPLDLQGNQYLFVGGQGFGRSTWVFDKKLEVFKPCPDMNLSYRHDPVCGAIWDTSFRKRYLRLSKNIGLNKITLVCNIVFRFAIIVGGYNRYSEQKPPALILDLSLPTKQWKIVPELQLPVDLKSHQVVSLEDSLLILGGRDSQGDFKDDIYKLTCTRKLNCTVEIQPVKLSVKRGGHLAMLVPDNFVSNCQ